MLAPSTQNKLGIAPATKTVGILSRGGALSAGHVRQFDLANSDAASTNNRPGEAASGFSNVVPVTSAGAMFSPICIAKEGTIDDGFAYATIRGEATVYVQKTSGSIAKGDPLIAVSGQTYLSGTLTAGSRIVAEAKEAVTTPTTPALAQVLFDGINGLATVV